MYVIWRSGLQPRWLLHITHILFRCGAMDGGTPGLRVLFLGELFFMNKKAPDGAFFDGRLFLRGKTFVREPAAATPQFSSKTTVFKEKYSIFQIPVFTIISMTSLHLIYKSFPDTDKYLPFVL